MQNSFKLKMSGRGGCIKYKQGSHRIEIPLEMSGSEEYDLILAPLDLREWEEPKNESIPFEMQVDILYKLRKWLMVENIKTDICSPSSAENGTDVCLKKACNALNLVNSVFCSRHYDESLLKN